MNIKVDIPNLNKIRAGFIASPKKMASNLQRAITRVGWQIRTGAMNRILSGYGRRPYDTGMMQRSIVTEIQPLRAVIEPKAVYAIYPHEGWSTSRKYGRRPFMEDSVKDNQKFIKDQFEEAVEKTIKEII